MVAKHLTALGLGPRERAALATLEGHADGVRACAVTPDGRRVVSASDDQTLKVWNLESGRALATLEGHADGARACAVTPDGRRMVSASDDKTLKVWVVRGFWEAVSPEYQPLLSGETIATAIARAQGNVLHAVMLHDALRDSPAAERRADRVPRGLKALIGEIWDKAASHAAVRVGLGLLRAAREALSLEVLAEVAGWSYDEKERFAAVGYGR